MSFRYRDPWTGQESRPDVEPYAVRRRRDRYFLEAGEGAEVWTYDLSALTELAVDRSSSFPQRSLPSEDQREQPIRVVLRVPKDSGAERRLCHGWDARVVGPAGDGELDLAIELDRANAAARLGVLVLQLGSPCTVVEPAELADVAVPVAERLVAGLPGPAWAAATCSSCGGPDGHRQALTSEVSAACSPSPASPAAGTTTGARER